MVNPDVANSARVTAGGRCPPKHRCPWIFVGGMDCRASPEGVDQRSTFSTSPSTAIR
jgi:hypothetical protein